MSDRTESAVLIPNSISYYFRSVFSTYRWCSWLVKSRDGSFSVPSFSAYIVPPLPAQTRFSPSHALSEARKDILHRYISLIIAFQQILTDHWLVIMRYQHWDVLLFPEGSKAPLQEFRTACFVITDPGRSSLLLHFLCFSPKQVKTGRRQRPGLSAPHILD